MCQQFGGRADSLDMAVVLLGEPAAGVHVTQLVGISMRGRRQLGRVFTYSTTHSFRSLLSDRIRVSKVTSGSYAKTAGVSVLNEVILGVDIQSTNK